MIRSNNSRFVFALMNIKRRNCEAVDGTFVLLQVCKTSFCSARHDVTQIALSLRSRRKERGREIRQYCELNYSAARDQRERSVVFTQIRELIGQMLQFLS